MDEGEELLSVDELVIACVFAHKIVYFLLSGLIAYFFCDFLSEVFSGQCALLIEGPAINSLHDIFSSLIDLPQSLLNLPHLACIILAALLGCAISVADFLLMHLPGLEVGGGAGGESGSGWWWFGEGGWLVEVGGGEGVEVAIGGPVQVLP